MIVAASTDCFRELPLADIFQRMIDLEYSNVEIALNENRNPLKPSWIADHVDDAVDICRNTNRLNVIAFGVTITADGEEHYRQFAACCKLAKTTKVVTISVPSAELGTPFNQEVEHLRQLVDIASMEGVLVSIRSHVGCLSEDPDTVVVLCDNVKGLGVMLDPSHYVYGPHAGGSYDQILKYVHHVQLRDTSKDKLQVRVGQGEIEYGRLLTRLQKEGFDRSLSVVMTEMPDVDHSAELRKMRLLLESLV